VTLQKPYPLNAGHAYAANLPELEKTSDSMDAPRRSTVVLCEDGRALGPGHTAHNEIRQLGRGRYSHWATYIVFSSSDNSDPNTNGREYVVVIPGQK
jgi:pectate lyase